MATYRPRVSVAINIKTVGIAEIFQPNNDYLNLVFYICRKIANIKNQSMVIAGEVTLLPLFTILFYCVPGINAMKSDKEADLEKCGGRLLETLDANNNKQL